MGAQRTTQGLGLPHEKDLGSRSTLKRARVVNGLFKGINVFYKRSSPWGYRFAHVRNATALRPQ